MNELRSTEILDKEIHDDAVKKAEKILQRADSECEKILASVDAGIQKASADKDEFYAKKLEAFEKDQTASIPLEKERFEVSFIQSEICKNINEYLNTLGEEKRIELVLKQFDFSSEAVKDKKIRAYVYGFDVEKIKKVLTEKFGKNLTSCEKTEFGKISIEPEILEKPEGIILETEDKSLRLRLTLSEVISNLLDKYRGTLSEALFGSKGGAA